VATKLYDKKGNEVWVSNARRVPTYLKNGYTVERKKAKQVKPEPVTIDEPVDFMAVPADDEETIRQLAKEKGIGNYWNKNLDALKEELGL